MGKESSQKKISLKPRVQIAYEVQTGDARELKEIPFVMGVMADLSGDNVDELPELAKREFTDVDGNSFDTYLKSQKPRASFQVENALTGEGRLNVDLTFESLDDFSPAKVAQKVDGLKQLFATREELNSLLTKVGSKPKLEKALEVLVTNPDLAKQLQAKLGEGAAEKP